MPNGSRLDLEYLACQVANVSFAVVNKQGISEYSPLSEICVHGGMNISITSHHECHMARLYINRLISFSLSRYRN